MRQYIISQNKWCDTYIYSVLRSLKESDNADLIKGIWFKIFEMEIKLPHLYEERRQLIEQVYADREMPSSIEARLEHKINNRPDNKEELKKVITGITGYEKKMLLKMFIKNEIDFRFLQERYKGLYYYMQEIVPDNLSEVTWWALVRLLQRIQAF